MKAFTDGATSNNGADDARGGWAYIITTDDLQKVDEDSGAIQPATNNICELTALINACQALEHYDGVHTVYTDSAYCINCYLQRWYEKWRLNGWKNSKKQPVANRDLWEKLIPYFENLSFSFQKVEAHSTNICNNYVDSLAVEAKFNG